MAGNQESIFNLQNILITALIGVTVIMGSIMMTMFSTQMGDIKAELVRMRQDVKPAIIAGSNVARLEQDIKDIRADLRSHTHP